MSGRPRSDDSAMVVSGALSREKSGAGVPGWSSADGESAVALGEVRVIMSRILDLRNQTANHRSDGVCEKLANQSTRFVHWRVGTSDGSERRGRCSSRWDPSTLR